jgi:hypothetical protein
MRCRCERTLTLKPDGTYTMVERDSLYESTVSDSFSIQRSPWSNPWLGFGKGFRAREGYTAWLFRFYGRDTIRLRHGDLGVVAMDGSSELFVRSLPPGVKVRP